MHLRRVFIPEEVAAGGAVALRGEEARYLLRVLRLRAGDEVGAFDGRGWSCRARIERAGREGAVLRVLETSRAARPGAAFRVAQALLKAPAMETVVQKCTELGAGEIIAFQAARSIPRRAGTGAVREKVERWRRIAVGACRQSRREYLPGVRFLPSLDALAPLVRGAGGALVAALGRGGHPLLGLLESNRFAGRANLLLVVGPEGDFTEAELARLSVFGAVPCLLSDATLRAETAAIAGAALIGHHLMKSGGGGKA